MRLSGSVAGWQAVSDDACRGVVSGQSGSSGGHVEVCASRGSGRPGSDHSNSCVGVAHLRCERVDGRVWHVWPVRQVPARAQGSCACGEAEAIGVSEPVAPLERFTWAGATVRYLSGVGGWVSGVLDRARFRTAAATAVRDALVGEVEPETRLDAEFLHGLFFDVRDVELVEIWRALAARRFDFIGMYEKDANNRLARERADRLRGCMLKVRSAAQARGVSVDFEASGVDQVRRRRLARSWGDVRALVELSRFVPLLSRFCVEYLCWILYGGVS